MGCIMSRCNICNIEILDETEYCPLCKSVLTQTEELENMYPDIRFKQRKLLHILNIYLFCAILAEAILVGINLLTESDIWWSAIAGLGLACVYLFLRFTILGKYNYKTKVFNVAVLGILAAIAIDYIIGYKGWSLDYVLPSVILLVDISILVGMIWNHRNWQSYIMVQLCMILCSFIPPVLYWAELENNPYLAWLPFTASTALFLGTMIIGDRRARNELKRRFHIV